MKGGAGGEGGCSLQGFASQMECERVVLGGQQSMMSGIGGCQDYWTLTQSRWVIDGNFWYMVSARGGGVEVTAGWGRGRGKMAGQAWARRCVGLGGGQVT
jgi:hypothetical protein